MLIARNCPLGRISPMPSGEPELFNLISTTSNSGRLAEVWPNERDETKNTRLRNERIAFAPSRKIVSQWNEVYTNPSHRQICAQLGGSVYNTSTMSKFLSQRLTRRQALEVFGISAAAAAFPKGVFAQAPAFPKGAIIRTILKDYAPEELAGGATLFHEHMQLAPDFNAKFAAATAAARAANGLPPAPARGGGVARGGAPAT